MPSWKCYFDTFIRKTSSFWRFFFCVIPLLLWGIWLLKTCFNRLSERNFGFVMFSWPLSMFSVASLTTAYEKRCTCLFLLQHCFLLIQLSYPPCGSTLFFIWQCRPVEPVFSKSMVIQLLWLISAPPHCMLWPVALSSFRSVVLSWWLFC